MTMLPPPGVSQTASQTAPPRLAPTLRPAGAPAPGALPPGHGFSLACVRCRHRFEPGDCSKLEHFAIYKAICPQCGWPGRYLASELKEAKAVKPSGAARRRGRG